MVEGWRQIDPAIVKQYENEMFRLLDAAVVSISDIKPSEWCEQNRMMTADVSPIPGLFSYDNSPYTREIVDCIAPDHPARVISVMKGAQIGFSTGVIEAGIGYIISQNPGNILFLVGHDDLVKDAMKKVDRMIDNSGIRHLIKSTVKRARNTKTGDTDTMKEYPEGYLKLGIANHKVLRNISMQYGFIDDFESMKSASKESGDTSKMIEQRFAAFAKKMKLFYISTPELKENSNIEPVYLMGDQRKYHIPAPCCGEFIPLEWEVPLESDPEQMGGITWKLDENGNVIDESVGYVCQKCGGFFDDRTKTEFVKQGEWRPTATPKTPGHYSYHISALYAPAYMYDWAKYARDFMDANPPNGQRDEEKWKTFKNLVLGQTYEQRRRSLSANKLQRNVRPYEIGILPEKLSIADGNGRIVMVTCGCDLNGVEDDARLDYEIVAHSASGATYSVDHGSIGTFIPNDKKPELREHFTYKHGAQNSVWPLFSKVISQYFERDTDGSKMGIMITGVDSGYMQEFAYQFVDLYKRPMSVLLKGDPTKNVKLHQDLRTYKPSTSRPKDLFLVESNKTKDDLASLMELNWDPNLQEVQPFGFMNFPTPSGGKYLYDNFFAHFEAEHKVIDERGSFVWQKKSSHHQNHLFDCRLYAMVVRDILIDLLFKEEKVKNGTWADYVSMMFPDG